MTLNINWSINLSTSHWKRPAGKHANGFIPRTGSGSVTGSDLVDGSLFFGTPVIQIGNNHKFIDRMVS